MQTLGMKEGARTTPIGQSKWRPLSHCPFSKVTVQPAWAGAAYYRAVGPPIGPNWTQSDPAPAAAAQQPTAGTDSNLLQTDPGTDFRPRQRAAQRSTRTGSTLQLQPNHALSTPATSIHPRVRTSAHTADMAEDRQPADIVEGATAGGDVEDEVQSTAKSAEDRKAAAALSKLDARGDDEGAAREVDQEAVKNAMNALGGGAADKKDLKTVKVDAADVKLLVRLLLCRMLGPEPGTPR